MVSACERNAVSNLLCNIMSVKSMIVYISVMSLVFQSTYARMF